MAIEWWNTTARISQGVPFAIDGEGCWRDAATVANGKECGCFCAECRSPLIARQGEIRIDHFAHASKRECRLALQTSVFGMTTAILSRPGALVRSPSPASIERLAKEIGACLWEVEEGLKELELTLPMEAEKITLRSPTITCTQVRDSAPDRPEIIDAEGGLAIHLLSTVKELDSIRADSGGPYGRILAINPLCFARSWLLVCSRADEEVSKLTSSTATDGLRDWLADSTEGRGWIVEKSTQPVAAQVKAWIEKRNAALNVAAEIARKQLADSSLSAFKPKPPKPPPDQPDRTLVLNAGVCSSCGGPQDEIVQGSGMFAGKRLRVCRQNARHPMVHLGTYTGP